MGKHITDYTLYRWRYVIGYTLISLMVIGLLVIAGLYIPGGLSQGEMKSVVTSDALSFSLSSFNAADIINLPYHLLQRASIELFGLSPLSIKLPSLILGLLSAVGMLLLLRMWFRQNVAVLTTILVITTGQFLFVAQSGTEGIIYIFWSVWLLVAAMMISRRVRFSWLWKMILFGAAALSLYTPLSIYILLALISAVALHPHLRYLVRRLSRKKLLIGTLFALALVAPLAYAIWRDSSIALTLLGIPGTWPDLQTNVWQLLKQYLDFISPNSGTLMTPIYGLGSMILIGLGIFRLATTKYTARSYITATWIILLLPVLVINPRFVSITFIPGVLLMAMGISTLLNNWYRLFPLNPYARLAGLVPLAVLIGGMVLTGLSRYGYGYLYNPETANNFSEDLRLVNKEMKVADRGQTTIIASTEETAFYQTVARHNKDVAVMTAPLTVTLPSKTTIFTKKSYQLDTLLSQPSRIVTDSRTNDSDRFYIYKTDQK